MKILMHQNRHKINKSHRQSVIINNYPKNVLVYLFDGKVWLVLIEHLSIIDYQ